MNNSVTWEGTEKRARRLHKALLANDRAAFTECSGERRDMMVVEIEDRGSGFCIAGDATDLLDDAAFERDRSSEDEGVKS